MVLHQFAPEEAKHWEVSQTLKLEFAVEEARPLVE
jgi:hypothetical protein